MADTADRQIRFDDQVAIVTGGAGSLGSAYALALAARGARVLVNDRETTFGGKDNAPSTTSLVEEIRAAGGTAVASTHDAVHQAEAIVDTAIQEWGRIDVVIPNAGTTLSGPIDVVPENDFSAVVDVNLHATVNLMRHAWPHLRETKGRAVLTSSGAIFGTIGTAAYSTSKGGVMALARTLGLDGVQDGVRVNAVMPAARSRMMDRIAVDEFGRMINDHFLPEQVASCVLWLAHQDIDVTGQTFTVGGGFAGRVALAVSWGYANVDSSPEDFRDHANEIVSFEGGVVYPKDSTVEMNFRGDRALGWHAEPTSISRRTLR